MKIGEADCSILKSQLEKLKMEYQDYCKMGLHLNISRGLPCKEQLDLNGAMFHLPDEKNYQAEDGTGIGTKNIKSMMEQMHGSCKIDISSEQYIISLSFPIYING